MTREHQISIDSAPNRCRACGRDIPPGSGLERYGVLDPLCQPCMGSALACAMSPGPGGGPGAGRAAARRQVVNDARRLEEAWARIEGIARAAKEDVTGALTKVAALHSAVDDLRRQVDYVSKHVQQPGISESSLDEWHHEQHDPHSHTVTDQPLECYVPGLGTVRECLDCGCLTPGGPTRCKRCAQQASPATEWAERIADIETRLRRVEDTGASRR